MDWHKARALLPCCSRALRWRARATATTRRPTAEAAAPPGGARTARTTEATGRCTGRTSATRGGDSAAEPITTSTVSKLKVKWTFKAAGDISATPAVVDGQIYVPDWGGNLNRIDAATGAMVWSKNVGDLIMQTSDVDAGNIRRS